ncbi:nuclear transport factor 2 family protein [Marinilongibacter aquaticus]|uniref:nuclear transport factor 2 family protein n=1 Tax=Marinilongibacter aquaticus TaxID=2975157 RepID=UPI0021BD76FC|nr:nuclear transport factor 2 family protein [Marinilongibacter aquaticus]UBM58455.1 nuclear transport factor 2 family protein [Marinilongibacter aquaticus]
MKAYFLTFMLLLFSAPLWAQSEEDALMKTLNDYLDGGTNGDVEQFKSAFLADAVQRSIGSNGQVIGMSVESLASKIKPGNKMDRSTRVLNWSYAGIAATATTETVYPTSKIIDYLNLVKVGNQWKITTRVYSRIEKNEELTSSASQMISTNVQSAAPAKKKAAAKVVDDGW